MINKAVILFTVLALTGCGASTPKISVKPQCWGDKSKVIGIVIGDIPAPSAHKRGGQGLLSSFIPNSRSNELEQHLKSLDISDLRNMTEKMTKYLKAKGLTVKDLTTDLDLESLKNFDDTKNKNTPTNYGELDYRSLKSIHGIDKLIVVNIMRIGTIRHYYGFVPLDEPSGFSHLNGYVVNLDNNQLEWKHSVIRQVANDAYDVKPSSKFDGLTKAVYTAFDQSKNMLFNHFAQ